ncbi:hypothetical protein N7465_008470 [Penicillium sp. CMV-2018d]|nr:hypothetical protein N7465_008470 [Penicillium sp. CMV-2018d]
MSEQGCQVKRPSKVHVSPANPSLAGPINVKLGVSLFGAWRLGNPSLRNVGLVPEETIAQSSSICTGGHLVPMMRFTFTASLTGPLLVGRSVVPWIR